MENHGAAVPSSELGQRLAQDVEGKTMLMNVPSVGNHDGSMLQPASPRAGLQPNVSGPRHVSVGPATPTMDWDQAKL